MKSKPVNGFILIMAVTLSKYRVEANALSIKCIEQTRIMGINLA